MDCYKIQTLLSAWSTSIFHCQSCLFKTDHYSIHKVQERNSYKQVFSYHSFGSFTHDFVHLFFNINGGKKLTRQTLSFSNIYLKYILAFTKRKWFSHYCLSMKYLLFPNQLWHMLKKNMNIIFSPLTNIYIINISKLSHAVLMTSEVRKVKSQALLMQTVL